MITLKECVLNLSFISVFLNLDLQVKNEVVIWDRIIRRKEDASIKFVGKNKYMFRDMSNSFK
jgi:hypothetical protein